MFKMTPASSVCKLSLSLCALHAAIYLQVETDVSFKMLRTLSDMYLNFSCLSTFSRITSTKLESGLLFQNEEEHLDIFQTSVEVYLIHGLSVLKPTGY